MRVKTYHLEASLYCNRCKEYFSVLKKVSPDKYKYIASFDSNFLLSVKKYINYVNKLRLTMEDIYFHRDSDWFEELGLYIQRYKSTSRRHFDRTIFNIRDEISVDIRVIDKWEKAVEKYNKERQKENV